MCKDVFIAQPLCPPRPMMSEAETACFARWIPQGGKALEFGMGGSTRFFFEQELWSLTSVESNPEWVRAMERDPFLGFFLRKERLRLNHADIGPVGDFGSPLERLPQEIWLRYHQDIWESLDARELDLVLVDGRFRVACACQALLRCRDDIPVIFHDFWDRTHYHLILEHVDVLDAAESIAVLRKRSGLNRQRLAALLRHSRFTAA